jgi:hypothetical protein
VECKSFSPSYCLIYLDNPPSSLTYFCSRFQSTQQVGVTVQSVGAISIANNTFLTASGTAIKIIPGAVNSQITISGNKVQGGQFTTEVFEIYSTNSQAIVTDNIVRVLPSPLSVPLLSILSPVLLFYPPVSSKISTGELIEKYHMHLNRGFYHNRHFFVLHH